MIHFLLRMVPFFWFNVRKISGAYVFFFGTALPGKTLAQCFFFFLEGGEAFISIFR